MKIHGKKNMHENMHVLAQMFLFGSSFVRVFSSRLLKYLIYTYATIKTVYVYLSFSQTINLNVNFFFGKSFELLLKATRGNDARAFA